MAQTKQKKAEIINNLKNEVDKQKSMIFVETTGIKTQKINQFKKEFKSVDSKLTVAKKTLLSIVLNEKYNQNKIKDIKKPLAVIFGFKDEVLPAKIAYNCFQQEPNFKILGGYIKSEGDKFLSEEEIIILAQLPSREELLARLVGGISSPLSNFINTLRGNLKNLIFVLKEIQKERSTI